MSQPQLTEILVEIEHETENAVMVNDGVRTAWLPRSQIEVEKVGSYNMANITLPIWLAKEKRLV